MYKTFNKSSCQFKEIWFTIMRCDDLIVALTRFYNLREEVKQYMLIKGKPIMELSDSKWLCDLAFMVDIPKYLSELNVKLQGPKQLLSSLLSYVKSIEAKWKLWQVQLGRDNTFYCSARTKACYDT